MVTILLIVVLASIGLDFYAMSKMKVTLEDMQLRLDYQAEHIQELEEALVANGIGYFEEQEIEGCPGCTCDCEHGHDDHEEE